MKALLVGGPFHQTFINVDAENGMPQRDLVMHDMFSSSPLHSGDFSNIFNSGSPTKCKSSLHLYRLEGAYRKDTPYDYVYRYQGR